jgi:hypothetical protein
MIGGFPIDFFSKKMYIWRHLDLWLPFWIFLAITVFFIKVWSFLKIKPFEVWKNIVPLIYCNFSKKGLLKSAILVHAAILDYFKKKFFYD